MWIPGWQSVRRGELVDGDQVFDRLDAELEALELTALKQSRIQ